MRQLLQSIPRSVKASIKIGYDAIALTASFYTAFLLRFNLEIPHTYSSDLLSWVLIPVLSTLLALSLVHSYRGMWRYAGMEDILLVTGGLFIGSIIAVLFDFALIAPNVNAPRSVYVLYPLIGLVLLSAGRMALRLLDVWFQSNGVERRRTLIVGRHELAAGIVKALPYNMRTRMRFVGMVSPEGTDIGRSVSGVRVIGSIEDIEQLITTHRIQRLVIINNDTTGALVRSVLKNIGDAQVELKTIPAISGLFDSAQFQRSLRDLNVADLMNRQVVKLDMSSVDRMVRGRHVMITGAGGSIGSELVRQVIAFAPERLILLDHSEYLLYEIDREIRKQSADYSSETDISSILGDIKDRESIRSLLEETRPEIILHAAAYKHVPLLENNSRQGVVNNIGGTLVLAEEAVHAGVARFVLISTDKAVNPTNVMGATKRAAEKICHALQDRSQQTCFTIVRFGNVLSSNGSVVPLFIRQIEEGGPVTITHPEVTRYFMSIPEASRLVLKSAAMSDGGEVFVLDMGDPIRIIDLARAMIRMAGCVPEKDIKLRTIGLRPGEKLAEELFYKNDTLVSTSESQIMVARNIQTSSDILDQMKQFLACAPQMSNQDVTQELQRLIPEFRLFKAQSTRQSGEKHNQVRDIPH